MTQLLERGGNAAALARAAQRLRERDAEHDALEAQALRRHAAGDDDGAAGWAQVACHAGWARPGTRLTAPALERMLFDIGRRNVHGASARDLDGEPRRVLHVMTEAYKTGGHTRVVERWVARDHRDATVVLTDQRSPLPEIVAERFAAGGATVVPELAGATLIERARRLRALALEHDLVVLHVHQHDVLPVLAFADAAGRPPVAFFDHASHQRWIGTSVADALASIRSIDRRVARERRGVLDERIALLPLPLDRRELPTRAQARRALKLDDDLRVVLSVAAPWKVQPVLEPTFPDLCEAVLDAHPGAVVIAVGPPASAPWDAVRARHPSRLAMPGGVSDLGPLLAAADVYLDTWPASGATTIVDVAAAGLPIVSLTDGTEDVEMVRAVSTLGEGVACVAEPGAVGATVAALLEAPERRSAMGAVLREVVARDHDEGWNAAMEDVVALALAKRGTAAPVVHEAAPVADWQCLMELMQCEHGLPTPQDVLHMQLDALPTAERPRDMAGLHATIDAVLAGRDPVPRPRRRAVRALAQPALDGAAIDALVGRFRELVAAGTVDGGVVVLAPDDLERGVEYLQAALAAGPDVEVDVVVATSLDAVAAPGDITVDVC